MTWRDKLFGSPVQKSTLDHPSETLRATLIGASAEAATRFESRSGADWYAGQVYVNRCVSIISNALVEAHWALYKDAERSKRIAKHPGLDALNAPNPYQDRGMFMVLIFQWLLLYGNAYVYELRAGDRTELYLLPADLMTVKPNADGWPDHYELKVGNDKAVRYELSEITHIMLPSTRSRLVGMSVIDALREDLQIGALSRRQRRMFWANDATPSGILYTEKDVNDAEATRQVKRWVKLFRGPDKAGKTAYLSGGTKYQTVAVPPKDAQWLQQHDVEAKDICIAFGVPLVLLDGAAANYATAREAKKTLWHETNLPLAAIVCAALSRRPWLDGVLDLDTETIDALQADAAAERDGAIKEWEAGLISFNRTREKIGEPAIPNGDLYLLPSGRKLVPADQLGVTDAPEPTTDGDEGGASAPGSDDAGDDAANDSPSGDVAADGAAGQTPADADSGDVRSLLASGLRRDHPPSGAPVTGDTVELAPGHVPSLLSAPSPTHVARIYALTQEPS